MLSIRRSCHRASAACSGLSNLTDLVAQAMGPSISARDFREDREVLISNNKKTLVGGVATRSMS